MSETERKNAQVMEALKGTAKNSEPVWLRDKNNSDKATQNNVINKPNDSKRTWFNNIEILMMREWMLVRKWFQINYRLNII